MKLQKLRLGIKTSLLLTVLLTTLSSTSAQVEFRDDNPFQFYNDVSVEEGQITMNENRIVGLPEPESDGEPVTQAEIGEDVVDRDGDSMTGNLDMQSNQIIGNSGQIDFETGQISDIQDISGLNFILPDQELQITEDIGIDGSVDIENGIELSESMSASIAEGDEYFSKEIPASNSADLDSYILLMRVDNTASRMAGSFNGHRSDSSSRPATHNIRFSFGIGDSGNLGGALIGTTTTSNQYNFVKLDYGGEEWYAIENQQGNSWTQADYLSFTGRVAGNADIDDLHVYDEEDVDNVEKLDDEDWWDQPLTDITGNLRTDGDLEVENNVEIGGELEVRDINARNFGETPSGVSHYLVGQSGERWLRWRDGWGATYDQFSVGSGDARDYDEMFSVDGDSIFEGNIDLDGNDITGVNFLAPEDDLQITDDTEITGDLDMSDNDITDVDTMEVDGDFSYLGNNGLSVGDPDGSGRGGERSFASKRLPSQPEGDAGGVWILGPAGDDHFDIIGTVSGYRTTGARGLREIHIGYSTHSNGPDSSYRASLDAMQSTYRSGDWQLVFATYEGEEYLALYHSQSSCCLETNSFFTGYVSDQADDMDAGMFEAVEVDDPDSDEDDDIVIEETVNYASYRYFMQDVGIGVEQPSSALEVDGDIVASGNIEGDEKNFVQAINDTHEAVYASQESDDSRAVNEDSAEIGESGEKVVELPDHFSQVVSEEEPDLKIQLTPHEYLEGSLGVTQRNKTHFTVQGPENQTTKFDYRITGIREGFEDREVVRAKE